MIKDPQTNNQLQSKDQETFDEIYEKYNKLVYYIINFYVLNHDTTKDLVQDTFLKVWSNIDKYKPNSNFQAWIATVARNTVIDYLRTKKEHFGFDEDYFNSDDSQKLIRDFDLDARGILSDIEYQIVILSIVYNLKRKEVAEIVGRPLGTVLRVYSEAIVKLRKFYNDENK